MSSLQTASIISDGNNRSSSSSSSLTGKSKEEGKTKLSKADIALGLSKKTKYDVRKDPLAIAAVKWNEKRPRPALTPGVWAEAEEEEITRYIDWHRNHPQCSTPRPIKENEELFTEAAVVTGKKIDEGNPKLVYNKNGMKANPIPLDFQPTILGQDCDTTSVGELAFNLSYNDYIRNTIELEDPWYAMSVKDQLEMQHVDGDHTTVKSKRSSSSNGGLSIATQSYERYFELYKDYEGGRPNVHETYLRKLEELTLEDKSKIHVTKGKKIGPFDTEYKFSKYTENGTALLDYQKQALDKNIKQALAIHRRELKAEKKASKLALNLPKTSSKKSVGGR